LNQLLVTIDNNRIAKWCVYALVAFPLIDYGLRLPGIHPIGVIWDKIVLICMLAIAISRYISGYRPGWFTWNKFAGWYIIFGLGLMFVGMNDPLVSIQGFRIDIYYMLYAFLLPYIVGPQDIIKILHVGASIAILIAVHGIYQYITKAPIPGGWVDVSEHVRTRVFSVLQSPNELGAYMALMTPIVFGLFVYETVRIRKWLYGVGTVLCAATLLFTFTRGAWVALAVALLFMAVFFERRLFILLVVLAVVAFFVPTIHHRIADLFSPVYWIKSSQGGRISKWLTAFDKMTISPLFGVGLGHYGGAVSSIYHSGTYSDNYYAKTLGESGIVGLVLFFGLHVALVRDLFRTTLKKVRNSGKVKFVAFGGVTGIVAVLFHNATENVFEFGPMAAMYFTYATLFLIWGRGAIEKEDEHVKTEQE
jgi:O-antigen ligase